MSFSQGTYISDIYGDAEDYFRQYLLDNYELEFINFEYQDGNLISIVLIDKKVEVRVTQPPGQCSWLILTNPCEEEIDILNTQLISAEAIAQSLEYFYLIITITEEKTKEFAIENGYEVFLEKGREIMMKKEVL